MQEDTKNCFWSFCLSWEEGIKFWRALIHLKEKFGDLKSTILEVRPKNKLSEVANGKTMNNVLENHNSLLDFKIRLLQKSMKKRENKCLQWVLLMADILHKSSP